MRVEIVIQGKEDSGSIRRFVVRASTLGNLLRIVLVIVGVVAVIALAAGWFVAESVGNGPSAREENALLRARLQGLQSRVEVVDAALERVMDHDAKVRRLSQLDPVARAAGIGTLQPLEVAAMRRDGPPAGPATERAVPKQQGDLDAQLDDLEGRAREVQDRAGLAQVSLAEVKGWLEDRSAVERAQPSHWPTRGWMSSNFGWRDGPTDGRRDMHTGIDVSAPRGTPVVAAADGFVVFADYHPGYGNLVVLDHGYGLTTRHGHLSTIRVRAGERVVRNELIGRVGNTGRSTGPHLHFEVLRNGVPQNPLRWLGDQP